MAFTPTQLASIAGDIVVTNVSLTSDPSGSEMSETTAGELLESIAPGNGRLVAELLMLAVEAGANA